MKGIAVFVLFHSSSDVIVPSFLVRLSCFSSRHQSHGREQNSQLGGRWALIGATRCPLYHRCMSTHESACCVACCRPCGRLCAFVWYVVGVWRLGRGGSEGRAQPTVATAVEEELLKPAAPPPPLWLTAPPLAPSATHAPAPTFQAHCAGSGGVTRLQGAGLWGRANCSSY